MGAVGEIGRGDGEGFALLGWWVVVCGYGDGLVGTLERHFAELERYWRGEDAGMQSSSGTGGQVCFLRLVIDQMVSSVVTGVANGCQITRSGIKKK